MTDTTLRGPDPEQFRTSYYGARWYIDPLPADDTWDATDDKWPAVSTVKKAWSKPFRKKLPTGDTVPLDAYWAAEFTVDNLPAINALADDPAAAVALICGAGKRTLNRAAERGTGVHAVLEDISAGKQPDHLLIDDAVRPYLPACQAFVDEWAPDWVAAEFVVINRQLGYGGTGDAIIRINVDGRPQAVMVDWKSRTGQHGCYEDEVAQIGGYSLGDYMVVADPETGRPVRAPLPDLDGGLVVSITPTGYEAYPVDLDEARAAFMSLHTCWREHRGGQKAARRARGNPLMSTKVASEPGISEAAPPVEPAAAADQDPGGAGQSDAGVRDDTPASLDRIQWLKTRMQAIKDAGHIADLQAEWPPGVPGFLSTPPLSTDRHASLVADACSKVEAKRGMPFGAIDPLFACFNTPTEEVVYERPATVDVALEADRAEAKAWADKARRLLDRWEPGDQSAICAVAVVDPKATMTEAMYLRLEAVHVALGDGLLDWEFGPYGPSIVVGADAGRLLLDGATKTGVLARAKPIARELGLPAPRKFDDVAGSPTLAALVDQAIHNTTTKTTGKQEQ